MLKINWKTVAPGFIIFLLGLTLGRAQTTDFAGGVLFNFNGIQLEGESNSFWSSQSGTVWGAGGLSAGIFVQRELSKKLYGAIELRYIRKGSVYEFANQYGNRSLELLKLDYLEIPVLAGIKLGKKRKPVYFETGFACAKLFRQGMAFEKLVERTDSPEMGKFRDSDFSWIAGVKFSLNRKHNLLMGARVEYSLFSIHKYYNLHNLDYGIELNYLIFPE